MKIQIPVIISSAYLVSADFPGTFVFGEGCPKDFTPSTNLTLETLPGYAGKWYANVFNDIPYQTNAADCITAEYTLDSTDPEGKSVIVVNSNTMPNGEREEGRGRAEYVLPGSLQVSIGGYSRVADAGDRGNYNIFEVDEKMESHSYVFACTEVCVFGRCLFHQPQLWVLSRSNDMSSPWNGKTWEERAEELLEYYRKAGASPNAVKIVRNSLQYETFDSCQGSEDTANSFESEEEVNNFWVEQIFGWFGKWF